jgi:hypothetical protein
LTEERATPRPRRARVYDASTIGPCRLPTAKVALSVQKAHAPSMAKTWVPKDDAKSAKAFAKAMRALLPVKGGRRQHNRPR